MPIIDSKTQKISVDYSVEELIEKAKELRAYDMVAIHAAGSGHPGGTLSIMDIVATLYLKVAKLDPKNPKWEDRDRIFWSAGHKAPALYVGLGMAGFYPIEDTVKLRKLRGKFEGHPNHLYLPGIEISSGSLGQGLGVAVGSALNARLSGKDYRVFCLMGDGEQNEGSIWEAVMCAAHYGLDNLVGVIDMNHLQIDGTTDEVMKLGSLKAKYEAFNWHVIEVDGHDIAALLEAFRKAETLKGRPTLILAETIKGKGVSYAENVVGYHGSPPKGGRSGEESLDKALEDIGAKGFTKEKVDALLKIATDHQQEMDKDIQAKLPQFSKDYWWNAEEDMKVEMVATRFGFGEALQEVGEDKRVVTHGSDITSSIKMDMFYAKHPERKERFFSVGIAEANMMQVASGFAKEGRIAFAGTYGVFASGRAWDQIRTTICYSELDVKIANAHGGISVGPDGATHQALEEIALMNYIPNMQLAVPCDSVTTRKITKDLTYRKGPALIRYAREATPVISSDSTPFEFGKANVIRYRGRRAQFQDAFDWSLGEDYKSEGEDMAFIACGPMVPEAMRAAYILKEEFGIEARVVDIHTVKPIDEVTILKAVKETSAIITCEEHQLGGFGNIVAGVIGRNKDYKTPLVMEMVGVKDSFGHSGAPWELMIDFELTAEFLVNKGKVIVSKKN